MFAHQSVTEQASSFGIPLSCKCFYSHRMNKARERERVAFYNTIYELILFFISEWLFYDDQSVIKILQKNVVTKDCYVLFYRRRDI